MSVKQPTGDIARAVHLEKKGSIPAAVAAYQQAGEAPPTLFEYLADCAFSSSPRPAQTASATNLRGR